MSNMSNMSNIKEPYVIKPYPVISEKLWKIMCFFSNNQVEQGIKYITTVMTTSEKNQNVWLAAFDFCRLNSKKEVLAELTAIYANVFNRPPPEWIFNNVESEIANQDSKGVTINILSMSNPESEQYQNQFQIAFDKKSAVLLKFTPTRSLSWQDHATLRLSKGIDILKKNKIPVYIESPEVVINYLKTIPFDRRTEPDWSIMFYFLLYIGNEVLFEEEALQYTLAKGMSPPSFEKLNYLPMSTWFKTNTSGNDDSGNTMSVAGSLSNHVQTISQKTVQKLNKFEAVTLNIDSITHADWTSIFEIATLHNRIWDTNSRKMYLSKPTFLIAKMLEFTTITSKSYVKS